MKFTKLVMQAFGTFKDRIELDFTNLNNGGIFLITGPTGGGKTTIFDAICFALYGKVSSNDNQGKIRSNFADPNLITYVELEFTISNKNYYIKRTPSQSNVLTKKGNIGSISHDVVFKTDEFIISDVNPVQSKIYEILGLNYDMFRQVVMLPQNDFRRLLVANTKEKEEIFRNIFNTSFIKSFQERIYEECKKKISEIEEKTTILNTLISQIDEKYKDINTKDFQNYDDIIEDLSLSIFEKNKNLKNKEEEYKTSTNKLNELKDKLNEATHLNDDINSFNEYKLELEKLNNDCNISNYRMVLDKYNNAIKLNDAITNKDLIESNIKELNEEIINLHNLEKNKNLEKDNAKVKREELNDNKPVIEGYRQDRLSLTQELQASSSKEHVRKELLKLDEELNDYNIDKENLIAEKDELILNKADLEIEVNSLKERLEDVSSLYMEKERITETLADLDLISEKLERKEQLIILIEDCDLEFDRLKEENIKLSGEKAQVSRKLQLNLASRLASSLTDGTPCPVCGSKDHPNLAHFTDDINDTTLETVVSKLAKNSVDTDQIIQDKRNYAIERSEIEDFLATNELVLTNEVNKENINDFINEIKTKRDSVIYRIENCKAITDEFNQKNDSLTEMNNRIMEINFEVDKLTNDNLERVEKLNEAKAQLKIYSETRDLNIIQSEIDNLTEKIEEYEKEVDKYTNLEVSLLNDIIEISKQVSNINSTISQNEGKLAIYLEEIKKYKELFNSDEEFNLCLNTNISDISDYVKNYDSRLAIVNNRIDELKIKVEGKELIDLSIIENEIDNKQVEVEELNRLVIEGNSIINSKNKQLDEIKLSYESMKDKIIEKNRIKKLSDLANGQSINKITFEQYILSIYFEDVIDEANILLDDLSKNRFHLVRKTSLQGRGYQGLEINLFDNLTASIRDVNTFSGGESFIASLSLALGLSNVIRRNSSLVSIDTLFIDEGFGSLDLESLDQAYNILCSLRTNDRVIGIISHVSELKNRIPNQIIVSKSEFGSKIKVLD